MSILGALVLMGVLGVLLTNVERMPLLLAAVVPFGASSAVSILGQSIVPYHVVAVALVLVSLERLRLAYRHRTSDLPGGKYLLTFCLWCILITIVSPRIYAGIRVLNPRRGIDDGVKDPSTLTASISNFAQSGYLILAVLVVISIGFNPRSANKLPAVAFGLATVLSSLKGLLPQTLQTRLFDNSTNVSYTTGEFDGVERMRGLFSEPSSLGAVSVAAFIFFVVSITKSRGLERTCYIILAGWSLTNAISSYSGGAVATGIIVASIVLIRGSIVFLSANRRLSKLGLVSVCSVPALVLIFGPSIYDFAAKIVTDKSGSTSAENRSAADNFSIGVLQQTNGLGAGLGSNRPSSFVASLLSNCGVVGTMLFAIAFVGLIFAAFRNLNYQPAVWAAITLFVSKAVAGPDISDPFLWFLLAVCARGAWTTQSTTGIGVQSAQQTPALGTLNDLLRRREVFGRESSV